MPQIVAAFLAVLVSTITSTAFAQTIFRDAQGWQVTLEHEENRFVGCRAVHQQRDGAAEIMLAADGRQWTLAFEMPTPQGTIPGELTIDTRRYAVPVTGQGNRVSFAPSHDIMAMVRSGARMTMSVPGGSAFTSTLRGSAAAMHMLRTCVANAAQRPNAGDLALLNCPTFANFASQPSEVLATLQFSNFSSVPLTLFWIDFSGALTLYTVVQPGQAHAQSTYIGHNWIARATDGFCMGGLISVDQPVVSLAVN